ncbi:hypothetical protein GGI42DRAFT_354981 [Trichoderma sp. SZMC 28013]
MNDNSGQFGQTTGHQSQQRPNSLPNPNPDVLPTPASPGYDESQNVYMQHIDTTADINRLQAAMRGEGRINTTLIQVLADPKYQDPRALHQLKTNYKEQTGYILADQIRNQIKGKFKVALLALLNGPLDYDVYTLERALSGEVTDKEALNDVLLCRSNADICAIVTKYNSTPDRDLVQLIRSKVDNSVFQLYSPIFDGTRAENAAPVIYAEIEHEAAEIHDLIESPPGTDTTLIVSIFARASIVQLRAISEAYNKEYTPPLHRSVEKKFYGSKQDILLRILDFATDSRYFWYMLMSQARDDNIFIYRALRLYWSDIGRLPELHTVSEQMTTRLKKLPGRSYRKLMIALIGEKSTPTYMHR